MYKRDARQAKISSIISWILSLGLIIYYVCLCNFGGFEMNITGYVLIAACIIYSIYSTVKAVQTAKEENVTKKTDK